MTPCADRSSILCNTAFWYEKGKAAFVDMLQASFPSCCRGTVMLLENIVPLFPSRCLSLAPTHPSCLTEREMPVRLLLEGGKEDMALTPQCMNTEDLW